jgi:hypothetical protein
MATKYWRLSTGGTFSTASNWSTSSGGAANTTAPASGDTLIFDQASTYTITFIAATPSVTIVVNNGAVTLFTNSYLLTFTSITVNGGSLSLSIAASPAGLTINGTGGILNYGTLYISSTANVLLSGVSDVTNYGTLTFTGAGQYSISKGSFYQYGTFTYSGTGVLFTVNQNFILQGSNSIAVNGGAGSIYLSGTGSYNIQSSGTSINARLQITSTGAYTLLDSLNITTSTNYSFLFASGGSLNLNGYTLTTGSLYLANSATSKTIIFNGGSIYLTAGMTAVLFNAATAAGAFNSSSSGAVGYIYFSSSSAKSFQSTSSTAYLPNCILSNPAGGGTLTLNISGSTIGGIIGSSTTVVIIAGNTINVTNPGIIADGNPLALNSSSTTNATLSWVGSGNPSVTSSYTLYHVILFASGTLYSTYCSGYDLYGIYSNGAGGTTNSLIQANSPSCGYNPPAYGTLITTYCSGFDLYGTYADGNYGTYNALIQANSPTCGYIPYSLARRIDQSGNFLINSRGYLDEVSGIILSVSGTVAQQYSNGTFVIANTGIFDEVSLSSGSVFRHDKNGNLFILNTGVFDETQPLT